jgi:hypothetical protein
VIGHLSLYYLCDQDFANFFAMTLPKYTKNVPIFAKMVYVFPKNSLGVNQHE